jgi:hypothetical protein
VQLKLVEASQVNKGRSTSVNHVEEVEQVFVDQEVLLTIAVDAVLLNDPFFQVFIINRPWRIVFLSAL